MALVLRDRVKETTTTAGTGTYTLAGAVTGFETFNSVGNGNTTYYGCSDGVDFEVGIGTYTASGTTLARTAILQSSNSDSAVNWGTGTRTIFCTLPAEKMSFLDASGNVVAANGSALTALNASNLGSGTVANARLDAQLQDVAGLAVTNGGFIVGNGSNFVLETEGTARTSLGLGTSAVLDTGISNTNVPKFTSGVADDDFLRVAGTAIEGRSASEVLSDIGAITASSSDTLTNKSIESSQLTGALPAISGAALTNLPGGANTSIAILAKTGNYTVVAGDAGKIVSFSGGAYTATLTAAATLGTGFFCYIENNAASSEDQHTVTIDGNGSETIDGRTTFILRQGERVQLVCDGSNFKLISSFHRGIQTNMRTSFFNLPQALGDDTLAIGLGTIAGVGNTSNSVAIGINAQAGSYGLALGLSTNAGSAYSTAIGINSGANGSVTSSGSGAMALGGSRASGADSLAAAIANNTSSYGSTGQYGIAIGYYAKASALGSTSIGYQNIAAQTYSTSIGYMNTCNSQYSVSLGNENVINGNNGLCLGSVNYVQTAGGVAIGKRADARQNYQIAFAAGYFAANGDAQGSMYILRCDTTDATATVLTTTNAAGQWYNQITAQNDSCIMFSGTVVAMQNGAQDQGGWEVKGLLKNDGGTTTLVSSNIQTFADGNGWVVALSADNTTNSLAITCTGEASHNIRWVANISTSEVIYA